MTKIKYVCSSCGYESGKWYGKCLNCNNWNTLSEIEVLSKKDVWGKERLNKKITVEKLVDIKTNELNRISSGFEEFDRVLGGGIVPGSVVLLSGDPGIGKSTLLLQVALHVARSSVNARNSESKSAVSGSSTSPSYTVFYVSGEESADQLRLRVERLIDRAQLATEQLYIISSSHIDSIINILQDKKPSLVIVDSIQTMETVDSPGFPGSIPQVRHSTLSLISFAKSHKVPVFLVGHVTKEGTVAGPMLLSHMVDCVLYLEGEQFSGVRILRAFKNRFGDSSEVGIFVMQEKGLTEIKDAARFFVDNKNDEVSGSCVTVIMEGSRPLLVEIQALVVPSTLSFPRRVATGISEKRLELLLAVIQKHLRLPIDRFDVFVNVVGGMRILEPASDLGICLAIVSSFKNKPIRSTVAISEVGLLGELRNVVNLEKRVSEARKFGFKRIVTFKDYAFLPEIVKTIV